MEARYCGRCRGVGVALIIEKVSLGTVEVIKHSREENYMNARDLIDHVFSSCLVAKYKKFHSFVIFIA